jgi:glutamine synthetase
MADPDASLADLARADGVRYLLATFTTMSGKPCSKLIPVSAADELQNEGAGFAGYAAGSMGQVPADSDLMVRPDLTSYTPLPFIRPDLALVHCDPYVEGVLYPFAPRAILAGMISRAAESGMSMKAGAEVEYFLVERDPDGRIRPADSRDTSEQPCYDARGLTRMYDHLTSVADAMESLGWGPYASDHEDGNGQFEQNFAYADAMTTADRVITLRYLISVLAETRGMTATFMPKPFTDRTGNGLHFHMSLWDGDNPLFPATDGDSRGLGLAPLAYNFIAGLLAHASGLHALIAPTVNSYKRTGALTTASGATWAPSRIASYGGNDRTHLVRVPDHNRIELRGADGSANPYLALAGSLAAGLDGIKASADPGAPGAAESTIVMPRTLLEAVAAFDADPVIAAALDCQDPGAGVSRYYADLKRGEFYAWHNTVSQWEIDRFLTAV